MTECLARRVTRETAARRALAAAVALCLLNVTGGSAAVEAPTEDAGGVELSERLIDRKPFDRIMLNSANDDAVIETDLLELPERKPGFAKPEEGTLTLRRLTDPSFLYEVDWKAIAKIELYEEMIFAEAEKLTDAGDFSRAFDDLAFLKKNYPDLQGLEEAIERHLWREASALFAAGKREEALPVMLSLYQRNPQFPRLGAAIEAESKFLIAQALDSGDYTAAREWLEMFETQFKDIELASLPAWRTRLAEDAAARLKAAQTALAAGDFSSARENVTAALGIVPNLEPARRLWAEIQAKAPEIRVGVFQAGPGDWTGQRLIPEWATVRDRELVRPTLLELTGFGAEGGEYSSRWVDVRGSASGLESLLLVTELARQQGVAPEAIALQLVERAGGAGPQRDASLTAALKSVELVDGQNVEITWRRPLIRPESLLTMPLPAIVTPADGARPWYVQKSADSAQNARGVRFTRSEENEAIGPALVVEHIQPDDEAALAALLRGDVDALDRVPPWQVARLKESPELVVSEYRLPTVHLLVPNLSNPLLASRDFRRALSYAIDRAKIVEDVILAGEGLKGFTPLSGPFPAGRYLGDPTGYGYDAEIAPSPYEPRLASVLAIIAREAVEKQMALENGKHAEPKDKQEASKGAGDAKNTKEFPDGGRAKPKPLVLAYPSDPVARVACQAIAGQLKRAGIPVRLKQLEMGGLPEIDEYDLWYAELAVWEPLVDARRLLADPLIAPAGGPLLSAALDELDRAENWTKARGVLKQIHRIVSQSLPVIPLWQTPNFFVHHRRLTGVGEQPTTLYQNLADWKKSIE